jgi:hypothetical protein
MKQLLIEAYAKTKKDTGIDPVKPGQLKRILANDAAFDTYINSLSEGLDSKRLAGFKILAENTRIVLLENSAYQLNPYETLALPLLRVFYPKTISKDLVTVIPMDKPEIVRGFIRATFNKYGDSNNYSAPSNTDISRGPQVGIPATATATVPGSTDILAAAGLTSDVAHVEKSFKITSVTDGVNTLNVNVEPTVDGEFSFACEVGGVSDVVTGRIDLLTGVLDVASVTSTVTSLTYEATISLEENTINPRATFSLDKLRLFATDRTISAEWSVQMEQDLKALYDVSAQAELVSIIGQQIVLDIDREVVNSLIYACERLANATHVASFSKTPPATYTWGPKQWLENIIPELTTLSARVYADTNIGSANTLACNPVDAAIFESLQEFRYNGSSSEDGDLGYESATVANGKWKLLVSNVVPEGKVLNVYKPVEELKAVYIFAPYIPCVLTPYPLGNKPSLSVLSRYGTQLVRANGISLLNVS